MSCWVDDLAGVQTAAEASQKSKGLGVKRAMQASGELHADARIAHRFSASQGLAEFRALRASVLRLYADDGGEADLEGVQRCNEAINEALTAGRRESLSAEAAGALPRTPRQTAPRR